MAPGSDQSFLARDYTFKLCWTREYAPFTKPLWAAVNSLQTGWLLQTLAPRPNFTRPGAHSPGSGCSNVPVPLSQSQWSLALNEMVLCSHKGFPAKGHTFQWHQTRKYASFPKPLWVAVSSLWIVWVFCTKANFYWPKIITARGEHSLVVKGLGSNTENKTIYLILTP